MTCTRARQLPSTCLDWKEKVDVFVLRVAHLANHHKIVRQLMFNADQTPLYFSPGASKTWERKGSKDVQVVGKTAKQSYTTMVTSTAAGDFLPIQVRSCPQVPSWPANAPHVDSAAPTGHGMASMCSPWPPF